MSLLKKDFPGWTKETQDEALWHAYGAPEAEPANLDDIGQGWSFAKAMYVDQIDDSIMIFVENLSVPTFPTQCETGLLAFDVNNLLTHYCPVKNATFISMARIPNDLRIDDHNIQLYSSKSCVILLKIGNSYHLRLIPEKDLTDLDYVEKQFLQSSALPFDNVKEDVYPCTVCVLNNGNIAIGVVGKHERRLCTFEPTNFGKASDTLSLSFDLKATNTKSIETDTEIPKYLAHVGLCPIGETGVLVANTVVNEILQYSIQDTKLILEAKIIAAAPKSQDEEEKEGTIVETAKSTLALNAPTDVSLDRKGHIIIADRMNNRIVVCSENGALLHEISSTDERPYREPFAVDVDRENSIYVADLDAIDILAVQEEDEPGHEFWEEDMRWDDAYQMDYDEAMTEDQRRNSIMHGHRQMFTQDPNFNPFAVEIEPLDDPTEFASGHMHNPEAKPTKGILKKHSSYSPQNKRTVSTDENNKSSSTKKEKRGIRWNPELREVKFCNKLTEEDLNHVFWTYEEEKSFQEDFQREQDEVQLGLNIGNFGQHFDGQFIALDHQEQNEDVEALLNANLKPIDQLVQERQTLPTWEEMQKLKAQRKLQAQLKEQMQNQNEEKELGKEPIESKEPDENGVMEKPKVQEEEKPPIQEEKRVELSEQENDSEKDESVSIAKSAADASVKEKEDGAKEETLSTEVDNDNKRVNRKNVVQNTIQSLIGMIAEYGVLQDHSIEAENERSESSTFKSSSSFRETRSLCARNDAYKTLCALAGGWSNEIIRCMAEHSCLDQVVWDLRHEWQPIRLSSLALLSCLLRSSYEGMDASSIESETLDMHPLHSLLTDKPGRNGFLVGQFLVVLNVPEVYYDLYSDSFARGRGPSMGRGQERSVEHAKPSIRGFYFYIESFLRGILPGLDDTKPLDDIYRLGSIVCYPPVGHEAKNDQNVSYTEGKEQSRQESKMNQVEGKEREQTETKMDNLAPLVEKTIDPRKHIIAVVVDASIAKALSCEYDNVLETSRKDIFVNATDSARHEELSRYFSSLRRATLENAERYCKDINKNPAMQRLLYGQKLDEGPEGQNTITWTSLLEWDNSIQEQKTQKGNAISAVVKAPIVLHGALRKFHYYRKLNFSDDVTSVERRTMYVELKADLNKNRLLFLAQSYVGGKKVYRHTLSHFDAQQFLIQHNSSSLANAQHVALFESEACERLLDYVRIDLGAGEGMLFPIKATPPRKNSEETFITLLRENTLSSSNVVMNEEQKKKSTHSITPSLDIAKSIVADALQEAAKFRNEGEWKKAFAILCKASLSSVRFLPKEYRKQRNSIAVAHRNAKIKLAVSKQYEECVKLLVQGLVANVTKTDSISEMTSKHGDSIVSSKKNKNIMADDDSSILATLPYSTLVNLKRELNNKFMHATDDTPVQELKTRLREVQRELLMRKQEKRSRNKLRRLVLEEREKRNEALVREADAKAKAEDQEYFLRTENHRSMLIQRNQERRRETLRRKREKEEYMQKYVEQERRLASIHRAKEKKEDAKMRKTFQESRKTSNYSFGRYKYNVVRSPRSPRDGMVQSQGFGTNENHYSTRVQKLANGYLSSVASKIQHGAFDEIENQENEDSLELEGMAEREMEDLYSYFASTSDLKFMGRLVAATATSVDARGDDDEATKNIRSKSQTKKVKEIQNVMKQRLNKRKENQRLRKKLQKQRMTREARDAKEEKDASRKKGAKHFDTRTDPQKQFFTDYEETYMPARQSRAKSSNQKRKVLGTKKKNKKKTSTKKKKGVATNESSYSGNEGNLVPNEADIDSMCLYFALK